MICTIILQKKSFKEGRVTYGTWQNGDLKKTITKQLSHLFILKDGKEYQLQQLGHWRQSIYFLVRKK